MIHLDLTHNLKEKWTDLQHSGSMSVSKQLPIYPCPKPKFILTCYQLNVGLGGVGVQMLRLLTYDRLADSWSEFFQMPITELIIYRFSLAQKWSSHFFPCMSQGHNALPQPGLEPSSSNSEPSALTTGLLDKAVVLVCLQYNWPRTLKVAPCAVVQ